MTTGLLSKKYALRVKKNPEGAFGKPLQTIKDVADHFGLHPMTVMRHAKEGKLPFFKVGGRWRARFEDIERVGKV